MNLYLCGQKRFGSAVLQLCLAEGHRIVGVSSPAPRNGRQDLLTASALDAGLPVLSSGLLSSDTIPSGVDLIISAHSHDFIGRKTRNKSKLGGIGYHPSLLPRHRGRDSVRWTLKMGDAVAGGTVYWLSDNVDAGDIAAQDWCWIRPGETVETLWREQLFPMGLRLFRKTLRDLASGVIVAVPQDENVASWEPSWDRQPLRRPDLLMLGGRVDGFTVKRDDLDLHP